MNSPNPSSGRPVYRGSQSRTISALVFTGRSLDPPRHLTPGIRNPSSGICHLESVIGLPSFLVRHRLPRLQLPDPHVPPPDLVRPRPLGDPVHLEADEPVAVDVVGEVRRG